MDDVNYDEQRQMYCPLSVALGINETLSNPTNESVKAAITEIASKQIPNFQINPTKGVVGLFYTANREADLLGLCREILAAKQKSSPVK